MVLALYRSGRQPDALTAYQDGRRLLVEHFGLEPSPLLAEMQRAILRQDPSLDLHASHTAAETPREWLTSLAPGAAKTDSGRPEPITHRSPQRPCRP
jgi:DNA-binding SARP family transcriptional activator